MRSIASNRYRLAPVNDKPELKRLLRITISETCWLRQVGRLRLPLGQTSAILGRMSGVPGLQTARPVAYTSPLLLPVACVIAV